MYKTFTTWYGVYKDTQLMVGEKVIKLIGLENSELQDKLICVSGEGMYLTEAESASYEYTPQSIEVVHYYISEDQ